MFRVDVQDDVDSVPFSRCWSYNRLGLRATWQPLSKLILTMPLEVFIAINVQVFWHGEFLCIVILLWIQMKFVEICVIFSHHQSMCCNCSFYFEAYCWKSLLKMIKSVKFSLHSESKLEIPKFIEITSLVVIFKKSIIDFKLLYKGKGIWLREFFHLNV